jgi:hypothetical protein
VSHFLDRRSGRGRLTWTCLPISGLSYRSRTRSPSRLSCRSSRLPSARRSIRPKVSRRASSTLERFRSVSCSLPPLELETDTCRRCQLADVAQGDHEADRSPVPSQSQHFARRLDDRLSSASPPQPLLLLGIPSADASLRVLQELFWTFPDLEPLYGAFKTYLEIPQRLNVITGRVDVLQDMLRLLKVRPGFLSF